MSLPKYLITVTTLSKSVALILFFALPILAFNLGINTGIEKTRTLSKQKSDKFENSSLVSVKDSVNPKVIPTEKIVYWDTFSALGITFKYPNTYRLSEVSEESGSVSIYSPKDKNMPETLAVTDKELKITIHSSKKNEYSGLKQILKENTTNQNAYYSHGVSDQQIIRVNDTEAYYERGLQYLQYIFYHDHKAIIVTKYPAQSSRDNEFDTFLKSLKFK